MTGTLFKCNKETKLDYIYKYIPLVHIAKFQVLFIFIYN